MTQPSRTDRRRPAPPRSARRAAQPAARHDASPAAPRIPRIPPGRWLVGPDYFGCSNSGLEPILYRDSATEAYLVGPKDFVLSQARHDHRRDRTRRIIRSADSRRECRVFRTRAAAVARYLVLTAEVTAENTRKRAECRQLSRQAQNGDIGAALQLGDLL